MANLFIVNIDNDTNSITVGGAEIHSVGIYGTYTHSRPPTLFDGSHIITTPEADFCSPQFSLPFLQSLHITSVIKCERILLSTQARESQDLH